MSFTNKEGKLIVLNIIDTIQKHKDYLSEIDGQSVMAIMVSI